MLNGWKQLVQNGDVVTAVQCAVCDRPYLLRQFAQFAAEINLPLFFWNPAYSEIQQVQRSDGKGLSPTAHSINGAVLPFVVQINQPGIFLIEGIIGDLEDNPTRSFEIRNAYYDLQQQSQGNQFVVLVDDYFDIPLSLHPLMSVLEIPLPTRSEVAQQIKTSLAAISRIDHDPNQQRSLVQACAGLPRGEIDLVLNRGVAVSPTTGSLTDYVMQYKTKKLQGRGITLLPEPDVQYAGGLDLLYETLEKIRLLLQPEAEQRNLRPPRAVLLWGIPGTGKSLVAKLAAKHIGATLVACDWNKLIGSTIRESMSNLDYLLNFVGRIGTAILFFDEFEKAFLGWNSSAEGGVSGKLAGRLLSWMQDHTEPVIMFATINRLEMLPPEMVRRFDYTHFFGMPHDGAMYQIFNLHLQKYFRYSFTEAEWRTLLREYRGCSPDEIGKAVKRVADKAYFDQMRSGGIESDLPIAQLQDLVIEREQFVPATAQRDISNQIAAILNKADYAKPVSSADTSIFARPPQQLMGIDENAARTATTPSFIVVPRHPAVEDV
ncbi:AAA family ATPase [Cyanobacteria bacterium FACHB-502]|nr:AAA family ATPase [Cyanobacteria bacterium FACHB-502]